MNESQLLETPAYPWIAQAARAQSHDGTLSHRMVEYLGGDASLNSAVVGFGHRYERQVRTGSQLVGDSTAQVEHGQALDGSDGAPHAGAAGSGRTDENQSTRRVEDQAPRLSAGPVESVTASCALKSTSSLGACTLTGLATSSSRTRRSRPPRTFLSLIIAALRSSHRPPPSGKVVGSPTASRL